MEQKNNRKLLLSNSCDAVPEYAKLTIVFGKTRKRSSTVLSMM